MPYEDLAVQLGESGPLDVDALCARICTGGRGGYCFEVNSVLAALLTELGFTVERHEAVVGPLGCGDPTNHLALVVVLDDGSRWLAEAGYGEGWLDPLPLVPGVHRARVGPFAWTVDALPGGGWWVGQHEWGSTPGMTITAPVVGLDAFAPHHARLSGSPESSFVQTLVAERPHDDRIVTLRARTLSAKGPGVESRMVLPSAGALAAALRTEFGIDPDVLGDERIARLWRQACEQHEAWVATRADAA